MYQYVKSLHIIFVVTWFAGMFYIVRLFIYNTEAEGKPVAEKAILHKQFEVMIRRLWLIITWPSAILTLIFGPWMWLLMSSLPQWLFVKLFFVAALYLYQISLHIIYRQQMKGIFKFSSSQLRLWNELSTVLLFAIVFLATAKQALSWIWAVSGLLLLGVSLMIAVKIYKRYRSRTEKV